MRNAGGSVESLQGRLRGWRNRVSTAGLVAVLLVFFLVAAGAGAQDPIFLDGFEEGVSRWSGYTGLDLDVELYWLEETTCERPGPIRVGGFEVASYRASVDGAPWGPETPVAVPLTLPLLAEGPHEVRVEGRDASGNWEGTTQATSASFVVGEAGWFRIAVDDSGLGRAADLRIRYRSAIDNPGRFWVRRGGNDSLELLLRQASGALDWSKIHLIARAGRNSDAVAVADYGQPGADWLRLEVPLADFEAITATDWDDIDHGLVWVGLRVEPGAGSGELGIDELRFTGGSDPFLWLGDGHGLSGGNDVFETDDPGAVDLAERVSSGGLSCPPAQTYEVYSPQDPVLKAQHEAERDAFLVRSAPPVSRPRLYGGDARWMASIGAFDEMPCVGGRVAWGVPLDVKDAWDRLTYGRRPCQGQTLPDLESHPDAGFYLTGSGGWNPQRALRTLHLVRRLRTCYRLGRDDCWFPQGEVEALVTAFVQYEVQRLPNEDWRGLSSRYLDIKEIVPARFWTLFLDEFWTDPRLPDAARQELESELGLLMDHFMEAYKTGHWSLRNGNNWTPSVTSVAFYWALAFFYEDRRAPVVLGMALDSLWHHRRFYLPDGSYEEGAGGYVFTSYGLMREINRLLRETFGFPIQSPDWQLMATSYRWIVDNVATDGRLIDFGDTWSFEGLSVLAPLYMVLWRELTGEVPFASTVFDDSGEPGTVDPCIVREIMAHVHFENPIDKLWDVEPALARDWQAVSDLCTAADEAGVKSTRFADGGVVKLRSHVPGTSALPATDPERLLLKEADATMLAASAVPNTFIHRELDFGALIWTVFGNRLLWDMGYGKILDRSAPFERGEYDGGALLFTHLDHVPSGANTLAVDDAITDVTRGGDLFQDDASQLPGYVGAHRPATVSGFPAFELEGGAVYGATDPDGWLDCFDRHLVALHDGSQPGALPPLEDDNPLNDGHYLVVDAFEVKPSRAPADVTEYWYTKWDDTAACHFRVHDVALSSPSPEVMDLVPRCHMLTSVAAEGQGRIVAAAASGTGSFVIDPRFSFQTRKQNVIENRQGFRYLGPGPVNGDVRLFLLASGRQQGSILPDPLAVFSVACPDGTSDICFEVRIGPREGLLRLEDPPDACPRIQSLVFGGAAPKAPAPGKS